MSVPRFLSRRRAPMPSAAPRQRRCTAGALVIAFSLGIASPLTGMVAAPATALTEYRESQRFEPEGGDQAGDASAIAGDYVAYVNRVSESVSFSHLSDPAAGTWDTVTVGPGERTRGFGSSIVLAADASRAYVSIPSAEQVAVYARSGVNDWALERTLTPGTLPDRVTDYGGSFGETMALDGDQLLVGAPNATVDGLRNAGMAFLVGLTEQTWTPLIPEAPLGNSITGQSVAISGDRVALGAVQVLDEHRARVGGVYLWDTSTMAEPLFTSQPRTDPQVCMSQAAGSGPAFGISLAFDETTLYAGSPIETSYSGSDPNDPLTGCTSEAVEAGNSSQGAVYRFDDALQQVGGKIMPPAHSYGFGGSIAVAGNALLANAKQNPDREGEVHVFDTETLEPSGSGDELGRQSPAPVQTLVASNPIAGAEFGTQLFGKALSAHGDRAVVGAPYARDRAGAVYLFEPLVPNTAYELTAADASVAYGEHTSIVATVAGVDPLSGSVSATVGGLTLGPVDTVAGVAELPLPENRLDVGDYPVALAFTPAGGAAPVATASATLTVTPQETETTVTVVESEARPGADVVVSPDSPIRVGGTVSDAAGTDPSGTVAIWAGGELITELTVDVSGAFIMDASTESIVITETVTVEARYGGDTNHLPSADAIDVAVSPGAGVTPPEVTRPPLGPPPVTPSPGASANPGADLASPDAGLASTGAGPLTAWLIAGIALLLLLGGGWVMFASRRGKRVGAPGREGIEDFDEDAEEEENEDEDEDEQ